MKLNYVLPNTEDSEDEEDEDEDEDEDEEDDEKPPRLETTVLCSLTPGKVRTLLIHHCLNLCLRLYTTLF